MYWNIKKTSNDYIDLSIDSRSYVKNIKIQFNKNEENIDFIISDIKSDKLNVFFIESKENINSITKKFLNICKSLNATNINLHINFKELSEDLLIKYLLLNSWIFDQYKKHSTISLNITCSKINNIDEIINEVNGVSMARNMINEPSNIMYPEHMAQLIKEELQGSDLTVEILEKKQIEELNMNLLLDVGNGSKYEPRVVLIKRGSDNYKYGFIGKGVTFDTGGISLKPSSRMEEMIYDMSGAAIVAGMCKSISNISTANFICALGIVENAIDGKAQRPGDIVKSMNGKTVEVLNTDAEGRLVLGDIGFYLSNHYKCEHIISIATLTGAAQVALGNSRAAVCSNHDDDYIKLEESSKESMEYIWRLPLIKEYNQYIESKRADIQNISFGQGAGVTTGAKFIELLLKEGTKFSHIDIGGVQKGGNFYNAFGVRLLRDFILNKCTH